MKMKKKKTKCVVYVQMYNKPNKRRQILSLFCDENEGKFTCINQPKFTVRKQAQQNSTEQGQPKPSVLHIVIYLTIFQIRCNLRKLHMELWKPDKQTSCAQQLLLAAVAVQEQRPVNSGEVEEHDQQDEQIIDESKEPQHTCRFQNQDHDVI